MFDKILMSMGMLMADTPEKVTNDVLYDVINYVNSILAAIIGVAVAIATVYAIVVGVRMAKANNAEEREEAKKKVIFTVIGIAVAVALMLVLVILRDKIPEWLGMKKIVKTIDGKSVERWWPKDSALPDGWSWKAFIGLL